MSLTTLMRLCIHGMCPQRVFIGALIYHFKSTQSEQRTKYRTNADERSISFKVTLLLCEIYNLHWIYLTLIYGIPSSCIRNLVWCGQKCRRPIPEIFTFNLRHMSNKSLSFIDAIRHISVINNLLSIHSF